MEIGIIGTSIWQQNLPLIENLTIDRDDRAEELSQLKEQLGLSELIYLATCNRVEFIYVLPERRSSANLLHRLLDFFFTDGREISFFPNDFYRYKGKDAIDHMFRTTASLESLVVGETQITGQISDAWAWSAKHGFCGPVLETIAKEALRVARRVRRETGIGHGAVSMASLAVNALTQELAGREKPRIALVGAGPMTIKCAAHLSDTGLGELLFVNRTASKAASLAERFGGDVRSLEDFQKSPGKVDAIITSTAARGVVFDAGFLANFAEAQEPVVCIDLAIPRDFSDEFASSDKAVFVDIAELRAREQKGMRKRFVKVGQASEIVEEEVEQFFVNRIEISLKPIFRQTHAESVAMAEQAFADLFEQRVTEINEEDRRAILSLVNKLLGRSCFQPAKLVSDHLANRAEFLLSDDIIAAARESG